MNSTLSEKGRIKKFHVSLIYMINCIVIKKVYWTSKEDKLLTEWINKNGPCKWSVIAQKLPGRTSKQCRDRWLYVLSPDINKSCWSHPEDQKLFELFLEYGTSWSRMIY